MKTRPVSLVLAGIILPGILMADPEKKDRPDKGPESAEGREGPDRDGPDRDGPRGDGDRRPLKGWKEADTDKNGTISREEFNLIPRIQKLSAEKQDSLFKRFDKNGDTVLSDDELKFMERPPHGREAMMKFRELDTDKSGGVSLVELKAGEVFKKLPLEKQEALFKRLDTDGDGEITVKDRPQGPPGGEDGRERGDRPGGGRGRDPRRMLKDFDENGDGSVSFEEFRKAPPHRDLTEDEQEDRFEALDKNQDKKLDAADFPPPPEGGEGKGPRPPRPDGPPDAEKPKGQ